MNEQRRQIIKVTQKYYKNHYEYTKLPLIFHNKFSESLFLLTNLLHLLTRMRLGNSKPKNFTFLNFDLLLACLRTDWLCIANTQNDASTPPTPCGPRTTRAQSIAVPPGQSLLPTRVNRPMTMMAEDYGNRARDNHTTASNNNLNEVDTFPWWVACWYKDKTRSSATAEKQRVSCTYMRSWRAVSLR